MFVSCVRAGEAKLRERVGDVLLNAGGPNGKKSDSGGGFAVARLGVIAVCFKENVQILLLYAWVLSKT